MNFLMLQTFESFVNDLTTNSTVNQWIDKKIHTAIQQALGGSDGGQTQPNSAPVTTIAHIPIVPQPIDRIVEKTVDVCPTWATGLEQYAQLIPTIRAHATLSQLLFGESAQHAGDDSTALLSWLTRSGQWSTLEQVWHVLAVQVQRQEIAVTATEQQILAASVALYNQSVSRGAASLSLPSIGQRYDYEQHTRVNHSGESVAVVLLAGLSNAQGKLVHCAIVQTH